MKIKFFLSSLLLANLIWPGGVHSAQEMAGEAHLPKVLADREIRQQGPAVVEWQSMWLQARSAVRQEEYSKAVQAYERLLKIKPDLEEARWELAKIWLRQKEWEKAAAMLERLLEADGDRVAYLNALATILQGKAHYSRSVELFGRALKKEPENMQSMTGIIQSLLKLRRKEEALPYLKRLNLLRPSDRAIRRSLANLSYETGELEVARTHFAYLAEAPESDIPLLEMAARSHERLGLDNLAIEYRIRILARQPDHQESHDRLARHYQKTGQMEEALFHFQALLNKNPASAPILQAIGRLLEDSGRFAEALPYFERYLALRPGDRQVLGTIVNLQTALGEKADVLASLERLLAVDKNPELAKIKLAAQLYAEAGRLDQAIPLYRRVLAAKPDDRETMAELAVALTQTGNVVSALSLWRRLTELEPGRLDAFKAMAEILLNQEQSDELIAVLERIHDLDPADQQVTLRLAAAYLERGEMVRGKMFLEQLSGETSLQAEYLEILGSYFESDYQPARALDVYEKLLESNPENVRIRLKSVQLAGELGKLAVLRRHLSFIESDSDFRTQLIIAEALTNCGVYNEALGRHQLLLEEGGELSDAERQEILLTMAALYRHAGLAYEAEQMLRMLLPHGRDLSAVLTGLFDLALETGQLVEAEIWLQQLYESGYREGEDLLAARLFSAKGEHRVAIRVGRQIAFEKPGGEIWTRGQPSPGLLFGRLLLAAGRLAEARNHLHSLAGELHPAHELERLVILQEIARAGEEDAEGEEMHSAAMTVASEDLGLLLRLAQLYDDAGLTERLRVAAQQAITIAPDSLGADFFLISYYRAVRKIGPALAAVQRITSHHPGHSRATILEAELLFNAGKFLETEILCGGVAVADPYYPQHQLLKGRALWQQNRWQASLGVYDEFLTPSAAELFDERTSAKGVYYLPDVPRVSLWQLLSYRRIEPDVFIGKVMSAAHAADNGTQRQRDLNGVAAPLYAKYRWQEKFTGELAARRSASRREYFLATKQFEGLLKEHPEESLMFDLAGIYSHQGFPGEEAVLYQRIASTNPEYPGLNEALARNRLKRRPRLLAGYEQQREEGRNGQKAISRNQGNIGGWFSPALQQEFDFSASRIYYQSTESAEDLWASRAFFSYYADFNDNLSYRFGAGVESPRGKGPNTGLIDWEITGRIGDKWTSYLGFTRDITTDTMASITRNIIQSEFQTGLEIDILPRLQVGGDYRHTDFSDSNFIQSYDLWASYIILMEPTFLKLNYLYSFKHSQEGAKPGTPLADGFAADDHPYWTPTDYWVKQFTIHFKHLLSDETFGRGIPRYYTLEYSLGYDSDGRVIQNPRLGLFLEWTERFIMEASAEITSSGSYRQNSLSLSGIYRW